MEADEQTENLQRVSQRISAAIVEFIAGCHRFHADTLRRHVASRVGSIAPGSADRILRDLRQRGVIDYKVISRRQSLYEAQVCPKQVEMPLS